MADVMTFDEREQYVAALRLLLADKNDYDIQKILIQTFPQFRVVQPYQLEGLRTMVLDAKNKLEHTYAQFSNV